MLFLGAGLIALIGYIAFQHRVKVVNDALSALADPYIVELQSIDFDTFGEAKIKGVTLTPKFADREIPLAYLDEVLITYDFKTIRENQKLKSISINRPTLHLDEKMFDAFSGNEDKSPKGGPEPKFDLGVLARFTDSFEARNGRLILDLPWHPPVTAGWEFESGAIEFDENGILDSPLVLDLKDLRFGEDANAGHIDRFFLKTRLNRDISHIEIDELLIERPGVIFTPDWLAPQAQETETEQGQINEPTGLDREAEPSPISIVLSSMKINGADFRVLGFDEEAGRGLFPDLKVSGSLDFENIAYLNGKLNSQDAIDLTLDRLFVGNGDETLIDARPFKISAASLQDLVENHSIETLEIGDAKITVSDEAFARFPKGKGEKDTAPFTASIQSAKISKGHFVMENFNPEGKAMPQVDTRFSTTLSDLLYGPEGLKSPESQSVILDSFSIHAPGIVKDAPALLTFTKAEGKFTPDQFNRNSRIEKLLLEEPEIRITDESLGNWADPTQEEEAIGPANRAVYSADKLEVNSGLLIADTKFANKAIPKIVSKFSLTTLEDSPNPESPIYHLMLNDLRLRNHARVTEGSAIIENPDSSDPNTSTDAAPITQTVVEEEVFKVKEISANFTAKQLQRDRRIEKIKVDGATLNVGHGLKELVREDTGEPAKDEKKAPETEPTPQAAAEPNRKPPPTWQINEIKVTNSQVRFEALVPQIEGIQFALDTTLTDVPLSLEGLLAQNEMQKIELSGIEIKDPYDSFITVAYLPTIFVKFSLAGLASQEIEQIDLIGPSLYVGQGLFWWIEYQREFREQNEGASVGIPGKDSPVDKDPDWNIKQINASAGKIVIAPTGVPLGMVPFPFDAETNMDGGKITLALNIPGEEFVYRFPDYQVDLYGLNGNVDFNVPVEDVNNNLVQTFGLKKAVWKKYEAEDLYLTVTFDAEGVYGKFGGEAYNGYAEGQFNYYLTEEGKKWDAWISGTNLDTGPLTSVIVPDNFLMDGRISLKLVSAGDGSTLGETTGTITTEGPGWIDITKLSKILEELPADWTNLQRSLTELALIGLKKFEYDKGTGSLYFQNREGDLSLRLEGPYGSRELNMHVHDWRSEEEKAQGELTAGP